MNYTVLRTIYENLGYYPIDDALQRVTECEAISFGYENRKELIKDELNKFLSDKDRVKVFIADLQHDINLSFMDFPDLCESYRKTINYLENLI